MRDLTALVARLDLDIGRIQICHACLSFVGGARRAEPHGDAARGGGARAARSCAAGMELTANRRLAQATPSTVLLAHAR